MSLRLSKAAAPGPGPEDPLTQERQVAAIVQRTLLQIAADIPESVLETLSATAIIDAVPWGEIGYALMDVAAPLERVIVTEARAEIPRSAIAKAVTTSLEAAELPIEFALINQLAVEFAEAHSGRLVVEISEKMRETIRTITTGNVANTMTRGSVVKILRATIPLHAAWAAAVDKAVAREYEKAMHAGSSSTTAARRAEQIGIRRARALTVARSKNIARTEAMTAMNEGKYAAWNEQIANGWESPDSVKEWLEGRSPCDFCAPLVGELVPWDQPFSNGQMMPPAHPSCRCTSALLPPDPDILAAMERQRAA